MNSLYPFKVEKDKVKLKKTLDYYMMRLNELFRSSQEVKKGDNCEVERYLNLEAYKRYLRSDEGERQMFMDYDPDFRKEFVEILIQPAFKSEALR